MLVFRFAPVATDCAAAILTKHFERDKASERLLVGATTGVPASDARFAVERSTDRASVSSVRSPTRPFATYGGSVVPELTSNSNCHCPRTTGESVVSGAKTAT